MRREDMHTDIQHLAEVSPAIDIYVNEGMYAVGYEDIEFKPQYLLLECYVTCADEINEIGIFCIDREEVLSNFFTARTIYFLRKYLSGPFLRTLLKNEENAHIMKSFMDEDDDFCHHFLEWMIELGHIDEIYKGQFFHLMRTDMELLEPHVEGVLKQLDNHIAEESTIEDPEGMVSFIHHLEEKRAKLRTVADYFFEHVKGDFYEDAQERTYALIDDFDSDKLDSEVVNVYVKYFKQGEESSRALKEIHEYLYDNHKRRMPHHIEYWENCSFIVYKEATTSFAHHLILTALEFFADGGESEEITRRFKKIKMNFISQGEFVPDHSLSVDETILDVCHILKGVDYDAHKQVKVSAPLPEKTN